MHSIGYTANLDTLSDGQEAFNRGDYSAALTHWRLAAEQGQAEAQLFVGLAYANGWGVQRDTELASIWYFIAAENNNPSAQYLLGLQMFNSEDAARRNMGVVWLKQAAINGDSTAKAFLSKAKQRKWFKIPEQHKGIPVVEVTASKAPSVPENQIAIQSVEMPISTRIEL